MTREEARNQLEGTWNFRVQGNRVLIDDTELIAEIALLTGTETSRDHARQRPGRSVAGGVSHAWSLLQTAAGKQPFN